MILNKIRLYPFAGISDKEIIFKKDMNVLLGPNEAGKSTVFNAIRMTLFLPVSLNKHRFEKEVTPYLPIGKGDTIQTELEFEDTTGIYKLTKKWGADHSVSLTLPDGSLMSGESEIEDLLSNLLPANEGSFHSVLMARQNGLSQTLRHLTSDYSEAATSLNDLLIAGLLETGGISVDKFSRYLEEKRAEYYSKWDSRQNYPENNRGVKNPYTKGHGLIVKSFYVKENLRLKIETATELEAKLDDLHSQIKALESKIRANELFVSENKKIVDDIRIRDEINLKLENITHQHKDMLEASRNWPIFLNDIERINKEIKDKSVKFEKITQEKNLSEINESKKELLDKFKRINPKKTAWEEKKDELSKLPEISGDIPKQLNKLSSEISRLSATINAGKLTVALTAKKVSEINYFSGLSNESNKETIGKDETFKIQANGKLTVETDDWKIEAFSGDTNIEDIEKELELKQELLQTTLKSINAKSIEEAIEKYEIYRRAAEAVHFNEKIYLDELGNDDYSTLKKEAENNHDTETVRPKDYIINDYYKVESELKELKNKLQDTQDSLKTFERYESQEKLEEAKFELFSQKKDLENKLSTLSPLPETINDPREFITHYQSLVESLKTDKDDYNQLILKENDLNHLMPEESAEEMSKQLIKAEKDFQSDLRKAKALDKIKEISETILSESNNDSYGKLRSDFTEVVSKITEGRYQKTEVTDEIPDSLINSSGKSIPFELMSSGMKDVFALALRLAISRYFLKDSAGFILMDDPFVDLDPERQKTAALTLSSFSKNKQTIILTCHPRHAEQFGGNIIQIGRN